MKAIVSQQYGSADVLQLQEVDQPSPQGDEVLVRLKAASVTAADTMIRAGTPKYGRLFLGLRKPEKPIMGTGFSGEVVALGEHAKRYKLGDAVFGETGLAFSANAEYVCISEEAVLARKPDDLSHEQAAGLCDGALTSWYFLHAVGQMQAGQRVLINGASGSLGSAAVQIAKAMGAHVTGICSVENEAMLLRLGADKVINYQQTDFIQLAVDEHTAYDLIYDTVGKLSFSSCRAALAKNGLFLSPVLSLSLLWQVLSSAMFFKQKAKFSAVGMLSVFELRAGLNELIKLIADGQLQAVIDRCYALEDTAEAHRYIATGRKKGNVVIDFSLGGLAKA